MIMSTLQLCNPLLKVSAGSFFEVAVFLVLGSLSARFLEVILRRLI